MHRNDCEAVLYLHRTFRPRRRTGRGFLTGTIFLDAALLIAAFTLASTPFVKKPGIEINLPTASQTSGVRPTDMLLTFSRGGIIFFNDEQVSMNQLETKFRTATLRHPQASLILELDRSTPQSVTSQIYDAAAAAGFTKVFIATQTPPSNPE